MIGAYLLLAETVSERLEDLALFQPALFDFKLFDLKQTFPLHHFDGVFFKTLHTIWVINANIY